MLAGILQSIKLLGRPWYNCKSEKRGNPWLSVAKNKDDDDDDEDEDEDDDEDEDENDANDDEEEGADEDDEGEEGLQGGPPGDQAGGDEEDEDEEEEEDDVYLLAKSYFDMKEYRRAAHVLNGVLGKKALFLRCYATYLVSAFNKLFFTCHKGLLYKQSSVCVSVRTHIWERVE